MGSLEGGRMVADASARLQGAYNTAWVAWIGDLGYGGKKKKGVLGIGGPSSSPSALAWWG